MPQQPLEKVARLQGGKVFFAPIGADGTPNLASEIQLGFIDTFSTTRDETTEPLISRDDGSAKTVSEVVTETNTTLNFTIGSTDAKSLELYLYGTAREETLNAGDYDPISGKTLIAYDPTQSYLEGDGVLYLDGVYVASQNVNPVAALFSVSTAYSIGDRVIYNDLLYAANAALTGDGSAFDLASWDLVGDGTAFDPAFVKVGSKIRSKIASGERTNNIGQIRLVAKSLTNAPLSAIFPKVNLSSSGDLNLIGGSHITLDFTAKTLADYSVYLGGD
ncbi:MAG: hypothetical protein LBQ52_04690 [Helicobacteraceae bacterium]|jgi:hypothetical protein|nr:hypothetical protein [Helicobacteraceae bacterium]